MRTDDTRAPKITFRAVMLGLALIPLCCMWVVQSEIVWYSGQPTTTSLFYHVVFILMLLTGVNLLVRWRLPHWALDSGELLTIYLMLCLASAVGGHDLIEILVPMLVYPHWTADPGNRWGDLMLPHLPKDLVVTDIEVIRGAFEGDSSMYRLEVLRAFAGPLFHWFIFIFAMVLAMTLLNVILRKQWTQNEKLAYPVIQIPMEMTGRARSLLWSKLFWVGFGVAAAVNIVNGLQHFFPNIPQLPIVHAINLGEYLTEKPWNAVGTSWVSFYPFAIGLGFFLPTDMAFSCWFFYLFWEGQRVMASAMGVRDMPGFPFINEQTAGGFIGISLIALWVSRRHLKGVLKTVLGRPGGVPDHDEPVSYRVSLLGIAGVMVFLFLFSRFKLGMTPGIIVIFFGIYFAISLAVARMRAELGPPAHDLHYAGPDQILTTVKGPVNLRGGPGNPLGNLVGFSYYWFFNRAYRAHPMAHTLEGFKIAERKSLRANAVFVAMMLAVAVGILSAFWAMLHVLYRHGMDGSILGPGRHFGQEPFNRLNGWILSPQEPNQPALVALIVGGLTVALLGVFRMRFAWWPFHPVGYAVSGSWSMEQLWFPLLLSWIIKVLILRYGGVKAYRPAVPFFVGLVLGEFFVGSFWNLWGIVFGRTVYHFWPY